MATPAYRLSFEELANAAGNDGFKFFKESFARYEFFHENMELTVSVRTRGEDFYAILSGTVDGNPIRENSTLGRILEYVYGLYVNDEDYKHDAQIEVSVPLFARMVMDGKYDLSKLAKSAENVIYVRMRDGELPGTPVNGQSVHAAKQSLTGVPGKFEMELLTTYNRWKSPDYGVVDKNLKASFEYVRTDSGVVWHDKTFLTEWDEATMSKALELKEELERKMKILKNEGKFEGSYVHPGCPKIGGWHFYGSHLSYYGHPLTQISI